MQFYRGFSMQRHSLVHYIVEEGRALIEREFRQQVQSNYVVYLQEVVVRQADTIQNYCKYYKT